MPTSRASDLSNVADLVVIGAGPAGLAAATEAACSGAAVIVVDESPRPGGRLPGQVHPERGRGRWSDGAAKARQIAAAAVEAGVRIVCGASVWGLFPKWYTAVTSADGRSDPPPGFESRALLLAAGASQLPLLLPGWTTPGVLCAGAVQAMVNEHRLLPGRRVAVVGIDPLGLAAAQLLSACGVEVSGVFLPPANALCEGVGTPETAVRALARYSPHAKTSIQRLLGTIGGCWPKAAARFFPRRGFAVAGLRLQLKRAAMAVEGSARVEGLRTCRVDGAGRPVSGSQTAIPVDAVITAAGLSPLSELALLIDCPLFFVSELGGWVPLHGPGFQTPVEGLFVAGSITGVEGAPVAEAQGRLAGLTVARHLELISEIVYKRQFRERIAAIEDARRTTLPLRPDIAAGRRVLEQIWRRHKGGKALSPDGRG